MNPCSEEYYAVYDVIAWQLKRLKVLSNELFYCKYDPASMERPPDSTQQLNGLMSALNQCALEAGQPLARLLAEWGIPKGVYDSFSVDWTGANHSGAVYDLISALCDHMTQEELGRYISKQEKGFAQLNSNVQETGIIILPDLSGMRTALLPPEDDAHQKEKTTSGRQLHWLGNRIRVKFQNILWIEAGQMVTGSGRAFAIKNYVLSPEDWQKHYGDQLVIAYSPIVYDDVLEVVKDKTSPHKENEPRRFRIEGLKNPDLIREKIEAALQSAGEHGADILMFPEMLGDQETAGVTFWERIIRELDENDLIAPKLILAPSWSHDKTNEVFVYDDQPQPLFSQQKKYPFAYGNLMEDLSNSDNNIWVLHVPRIGRVLIAICRDMLDAEYFPLLLEQLEPSLILSPSFSPGTTQFDLMESMAVPFGCFVVWGNTCAAHYKTGHASTTVGIVCKPFGNESERVCYIERQCDQKCAECSGSCLFLITITLDEKYAVQYKHVSYPAAPQLSERI